MESRGYRGGEGRTRYREMRFRVSDALAVAVTLLILLVGILL
jgi:energy-coupling factor transport system permease protein